MIHPLRSVGEDAPLSPREPCLALLGIARWWCWAVLACDPRPPRSASGLAEAVAGHLLACGQWAYSPDAPPPPWLVTLAADHYRLPVLRVPACPACGLVSGATECPECAGGGG